MSLLCRPWFATTNFSDRFPILETSATALCGTTGTMLIPRWTSRALLRHYQLLFLRFPIVFLAVSDAKLFLNGKTHGSTLHSLPPVKGRVLPVLIHIFPLTFCTDILCTNLLLVQNSILLSALILSLILQDGILTYHGCDPSFIGLLQQLISTFKDVFGAQDV